MIAAKAVCFLEAMQPEFVDYQKQVVGECAARWRQSLADEGFRIVSGGTDTHLLLVDVFAKGVRGKEAEQALDQRAHHRQQERHSVRRESAAESERHPSGQPGGDHARIRRGRDEGSRRLHRAGACATQLGRESRGGSPAGQGPDGRFPLYSWKATQRRRSGLMRCLSASSLMSGTSTTSGSAPIFGIWLRRSRRSTARTTTLLQLPLPKAPEIAGLPANFETAIYHPPKRAFWDDITFAWFLKALAPDVVHMPLNQVPWLLPKPYVVTIHDMSSFLFGEMSRVRENAGLYRFRRGLLRADRVIAVSAATRRDVENVLGCAARPDPAGVQRA